MNPLHGGDFSRKPLSFLFLECCKVSEPVETIKRALSREFVVLCRTELEKTLRELEEAVEYIRRVRGREDCGFLVCQAQIKLIKSLLGEEMFG